MNKWLLVLFLPFLLLFNDQFALQLNLTATEQLKNGATCSLYNALEFPLKAYVVKIPTDNINIKLIPAIGQREEVSSIAQRTNAFIAINGSNYRRGGKYNGNRVNLFTYNDQVITDVGFPRGSFGWNNTSKNSIFDIVYLKTQFHINNEPYRIDQINQPRMQGHSVLYTDSADIALLSHAIGTQIYINEKGIITGITQSTPTAIKPNCYVYQIDKAHALNIQKGMQTSFSYTLESFTDNKTYEFGYDFFLGGAGLLIHNRVQVSNKLQDEFRQGKPIVHCGDEIVADFSTDDQQQLLIKLRHPRTAIGITKNHEFCIAVVDGRQSESQGLTLPELAEFMLQIGCQNALNIGGGGCSTLYIDGATINSPSSGYERPVSEALCFYREGAAN